MTNADEILKQVMIAVISSYIIRCLTKKKNAILSIIVLIEPKMSKIFMVKIILIDLTHFSKMIAVVLFLTNKN